MEMDNDNTTNPESSIQAFKAYSIFTCDALDVINQNEFQEKFYADDLVRIINKRSKSQQLGIEMNSSNNIYEYTPLHLACYSG